LGEGQVKKEIDWHGKPSILGNRDCSRFGAPPKPAYNSEFWEFFLGPGAWMGRAECPAGWDERDALV
jgi:hypothetical protein